MRGNDFRSYAVKGALVLNDGRAIDFYFCFESFAITEQIYADVFKHDVDISRIIMDLSEGMSIAVLALAYGAVAVKNDISFDEFLDMVHNEADKLFLQSSVITCLQRTFYDSYRGAPSGEQKTEFQWDTYYKNALALGMSDAEFWAATPRKIQLLMRDKEAEESARRLTAMYL